MIIYHQIFADLSEFDFLDLVSDLLNLMLFLGVRMLWEPWVSTTTMIQVEFPVQPCGLIAGISLHYIAGCTVVVPSLSKLKHVYKLVTSRE